MTPRFYVFDSIPFTPFQPWVLPSVASTVPLSPPGSLSLCGDGAWLAIGSDECSLNKVVRIYCIIWYDMILHIFQVCAYRVWTRSMPTSGAVPPPPSLTHTMLTQIGKESQLRLTDFIRDALLLCVSDLLRCLCPQVGLIIPFPRWWRNDRNILKRRSTLHWNLLHSSHICKWCNVVMFVHYALCLRPHYHYILSWTPWYNNQQ